MRCAWRGLFVSCIVCSFGVYCFLSFLALLWVPLGGVCYGFTVCSFATGSRSQKSLKASPVSCLHRGDDLEAIILQACRDFVERERSFNVFATPLTRKRTSALPSEFRSRKMRLLRRRKSAPSGLALRNALPARPKRIWTSLTT